MGGRKERVVSGFIWRLAERFGAQAVSLVVSIFLARLVDVQYHGTISLVIMVITIVDVFVDGGLGQSLIQKTESDDLDFSSVFYFNCILCSVLYAIIWFGAPLFAAFFNDASLVSVLRVLGTCVIFNGVKNIQVAYVSKKMEFRKFFFSTLVGTVGSAVVGIAMAYKGFGIWALVAQFLFNTAVDTIILWITVEWKPKLMFSWKRLKGLLSFGWKIFASDLFSLVCEQMNQLAVGKHYSSSDLAYYNKGSHFPEITIANIIPAIDGVLFPTLSEEQHNFENRKRIMRRGVSLSTYIAAPIMIGMAACAKSLIVVLLTDKWLLAVPFLQIFCLRSIIRPLLSININSIKAIGDSGTTLILEIIRGSLGILLLVITIQIGAIAMAWGVLISTALSYLVIAVMNGRKNGYGLVAQIVDIIPELLVAAAMGAIVYLIGLMDLKPILLLALQVVSGVLSYILLSMIFHLENFYYVLDTAKGFLQKRHS